MPQLAENEGCHLQKMRFYCQPVSLNRLNLWLWLSCILFLGIIFQLEKTDAISLVAIILGVIFLILAIYVGLSSYILLEPAAHQLSLRYPFSRQGLIISPQQFTLVSESPRTITIKSKGTSQYRFWLGTKKTQQLLKYWEELI